MKIRLFNDIDQIYQSGIIYPDSSQNGKHQCSVCGKDFTTEKRALTHYNKRSCFKVQDIFKGTVSEDCLYEIYDELTVVTGGYRLSKARFGTSRYYPTTGKFYLYCYNNSIVDIFDYLNYIINREGSTTYFQILSLGQKDSVLKRYRKKLARSPNKESVEAFLRANEERVYSDPSFTIRSLERGDLSVSILEEKIDIDRFIDSLTDMEAERLSLFLDSTR